MGLNRHSENFLMENNAGGLQSDPSAGLGFRVLLGFGGVRAFFSQRESGSNLVLMGHELDRAVTGPKSEKFRMLIQGFASELVEIQDI